MIDKEEYQEAFEGYKSFVKDFTGKNVPVSIKDFEEAHSDTELGSEEPETTYLSLVRRVRSYIESTNSEHHCYLAYQNLYPVKGLKKPSELISSKVHLSALARILFPKFIERFGEPVITSERSNLNIDSKVAFRFRDLTVHIRLNDFFELITTSFYTFFYPVEECNNYFKYLAEHGFIEVPIVSYTQFADIYKLLLVIKTRKESKPRDIDYLGEKPSVGNYISELIGELDKRDARIQDLETELSELREKEYVHYIPDKIRMECLNEGGVMDWVGYEKSFANDLYWMKWKEEKRKLKGNRQ